MDAIDHQLVIAGIGIAKPEDDPYELINKLITYHVQLARDPLVSEEAQKLAADGRRLEWSLKNAAELTYKVMKPKDSDPNSDLNLAPQIMWRDRNGDYQVVDVPGDNLDAYREGIDLAMQDRRSYRR